MSGARAVGRRLLPSLLHRRRLGPPSTRPLWSSLFENDKFGEYDAIAGPGYVSDARTVPVSVRAPPYASTGRPTEEPDADSPPEVHADDGVRALRRTCRLAMSVLEAVGREARVGVTTDELDAFAHHLIVDRGAYPSPLNYMGFRKSLCTSVNNVLCHGVPDDRPLRDGDVVSLDVSVYRDGVHGDCCATYCVGRVDEPGLRLVDAAHRCALAGLAACGPGRWFDDIGAAIESCARAAGHAVVPSITGHGIGAYFHGPPTVFHSGRYHYPGAMKPGMVFTVEPVVVQGNGEIAMWDDGWTIVAEDDSRGAQFEYTILITNDGYEILTKL